MSRFFIRIELNDAYDEDYVNLHDALYDAKVYKVIIGGPTNNRTWKALPTGYYTATREALSEEGMNKTIVRVLNSIGKYNSKDHRDYELVITKADGFVTDLEENIGKYPLPQVIK